MHILWRCLFGGPKWHPNFVRILHVRSSYGEFLYNAKTRNINIGTVFICGKCQKGELGLVPQTGDYCPECSARVEEVIRETSRRNYAVG